MTKYCSGLNMQSTLVFPAIFLVLSTILISTNFVISSPLPCIYDEIQPKIVGKKTHVKYTKPTKTDARNKRSLDDLFEPIRINWSVHNLDDYVDMKEIRRLTKVTRDAVSVIQKLLLVIPLSEPLLIERSACSYSHLPPHDDKCAGIFNDYTGEKCLDGFLIPDDHLEGLWLWNDMAIVTGQPIRRYSNGTGLSNTDTVLYMKKQHTQQCANRPDIVAFAAYCKQDQTGRPVAGVVNFCPNHLHDGRYNEDKFIVLTVHEIFHVLGFSCKLIPEFRDCSIADSATDCAVRKKVTTLDTRLQYRLETPAVKKETRQQFGCTDNAYLGGPLENVAAGSCSYSSHWESRFMTGSIMAPSIGKDLIRLAYKEFQCVVPHQIFLDRMTLAVFEDSGWYKVNYDLAQVLPWGDNQGCSFGLKSTCQVEESEFFCNTSQSSSGCHYLHLDKGTCSTNSLLEQCPVFTASSMDQCSVESDPGLSTPDGETFHPDSRCFVSTLALKGLEPCHPEGRCYLTLCNQTSQEYSLKIGNGSWVICPERTDITIPGYNGVVSCPPFERVCANLSSILDLVDPCCPSTSPAVPTITSTSMQAITVVHTLCVSMEFGDLAYEQVIDTDQQMVFTENVRDTVCDTTKLMKNRVVSLEVFEEQMIVVVTFDINEGDDGMQSEHVVSIHEAYQDLQTAVTNETFEVPHMGQLYKATAIRIMNCSSSTATMSYTNDDKLDASSSKDTVPLAIGLTVCMTLLLIMIMYACYKKKVANNAVGPASEEDEMSPYRPHRTYMVGEVNGSRTGKL